MEVEVEVFVFSKEEEADLLFFFLMCVVCVCVCVLYKKDHNVRSLNFVIVFVYCLSHCLHDKLKQNRASLVLDPCCLDR